MKQIKQSTLAVLSVIMIGCSDREFYEMPDSATYMNPVIAAGQIVSVKLFSEEKEKRISELNRFEIVVVRDPPHAGGDYPYRIIALPNEKISFLENGVLIDGKKIKLPPWIGYLEQRLKGAKVIGSRSINLSSEEYFVIGDNVEVAFDSRYFGPIKAESIIGIIDKKL